MTDEVDLNREILIFLVGLETHLGRLQLLDLVLESLRVFLKAPDALVGILLIRLRRLKIGTHTGKTRGFKGFAPRKILKFELKLANAAVNFLQIHQRFYDRHLALSFS